MAVLWVIALLTMLVGTTTLLLREDVETASTRRQMFRARMLAEHGLAVAAHPDVKQDDEFLLRHQVAPGEGWIVEVEGEDGRLNPNILLQREDRDTLRRVMRAWGLKFDEGERVIDALMDWVDPDDFVRGVGGAESRFYGVRGVPFNRPFRSVDDMAQVRYMNEVERIFPGWRQWFSTYSTGVVDVNEAPAEVLSALTGADPTIAQQFVARRTGRDGIPHTKDDLPFQDLQTALRVLGVTATNPQALAGILGVQSSITRIKSTGVTGDFRRSIYAIINRPTSNTPGTAAGAGGGIANILWLGEEDELPTPGKAARFSTERRQ
ncbi:MAG: general secretion pathway protein GspK [Verrucomicrobiaceae bacterium]